MQQDELFISLAGRKHCVAFSSSDQLAGLRDHVAGGWGESNCSKQGAFARELDSHQAMIAIAMRGQGPSSQPLVAYS